MISNMRRRSRLIMFILAISFVVGFVLLSLGGLLDTIRQLTNRESVGPRRPDELGRVENKVITQVEYENLKNYYKWLYLENTRTRNVPAGVEEQIAQQTWSYLVNEKSLEETYKKERIELLFDEVLEILKMAPPREVMSDTAMYTDGKFDPKKYERVLYTQRFIQTHFPPYRDYIRNARLEATLKTVFRVPTPQTQYDQARDNTRFNITFLALEPNSFVKSPGDKELWAYYAGRKGQFTKPERRTLRYAVFPLKLGAEDSLAAKTQIDDIASSLKTPDDFLYQTDRSYDSTGMWFKTDSVDSAVRGALTNLPPDSVSKPLLTKEGWQIVKLDERAKDSVRLRFITVPVELTAGTYSALRDKIDNLTQRSKEENFDTVAKELGVDARDAPPLEKGKKYEFDPELSGTIEVFAKHAKIGDVSQPLRTTRNDVYLFKLTGIQRGMATVMDSFEIRNKVSSKMVTDKARPLMEARAQEILRQIKAGKSLDEVAKGDSQVRVQTRQQVTPAAVSYLGPEFAGTMYALLPGQASGVVRTERGMYVIRCDGRQENPPAPNPYYAVSKMNAALQRVRESVLKQPRVIDYRNPFSF
jgi:parvulin-like peptidyl-prolyl isomerase